jgi:hypothetical protein
LGQGRFPNRIGALVIALLIGKSEDPRQKALDVFQNSDILCFQQLQWLPWNCETLENTWKTQGAWVIAVVNEPAGTFVTHKRLEVVQTAKGEIEMS